MRSLIYIPIIHTQADMGALAESIREITILKLGEERWENSMAAIDKFWDVIGSEIDRWALPYCRVRLYQDGLPLCGRELEIVTDLANSDSRNHQLILQLIEKGAILMGTESPELLLQEYALIKQALTEHDQTGVVNPSKRREALSRNLLRKRDRYIAERINDTLGAEEIGILFLGMVHSPEPWLAPDILVSYPICPSASRKGGKPSNWREENGDEFDPPSADRG